MNQNLITENENAELILREGWNLFQQKGYRGATVDELCRRCNLTKPTLYYYFKDKENLFVEVLQHQLRGFHTTAEQPGSSTERLVRVATSILESFQSPYSNLLHDREHIKDPENQKRIREAFRSGLFDPITSIMKTGIRNGDFHDEDPQTLTLFFLGCINNFIGRSVIMKLDNAELAEKLTSYFIKGVQEECH